MNYAYRHKENMDQVSIEYSFKTNGKFDKTEKKTWSNRYSSFTDWQKCDSAYLDGSPDYGEYYCNGKILFDLDFNEYSGTYRFDWKDSNGNWWYTYELEDYKKGYRNTYKWVSTKCMIRDGYYTDWKTTLYQQYNETLDEHWAALVMKRKFYERVTPQF